MPTAAEPPATVGAGLAAARRALAARGDEPVAALWLWSRILARPPAWLLAHPEAPLGGRAARRGGRLLARLADGHSVAHLCGSAPFLDFELRLTPRTPAPRADTETLAAAALDGLPRRARALDWGAGAGTLALALARARPDCRIVGLDRVRGSAALARANALRLRLRNARFARADWRGAWPAGKFDLIVANPPYVAPRDPRLREAGVRREPRGALAATERGLRDLRLIAAGAQKCLRPRGRLLLEHGAEQADAARRAVARAGFGRARTLRDARGLPRACLARV